MELVLAGLPEPKVQYRIEDEHGFVLARADLAYPEAKLAIEYDGRTHLNPVRAERDRQRDATLASYGWETLHLGRDQLYALPQTLRTIRTMLTLRLPAHRLHTPGGN
uniref:endonuclease domain-containing protein n=1 Tax=Pseudonocardia sp. CA-138482 TaxID=3240023 RepID=UPI003F491F6E